MYRLFGCGMASSISKYEEGLNRETIFFGMVLKAFNRIRNAEIIIIDGIFMISSSMLELIDYICKEAAENKKPFGGKQMIFFRDFLQLPPLMMNLHLNLIYDHLPRLKQYT